MTVRTRFAPSPTGYLHIGGARTALFNWLLARRHGGKFILRIDDTDEARHVEEAIALILDGFRWLGMNWDEGPEVGGDHAPYFQSQRSALYEGKLRRLIQDGFAYPDTATTEEVDTMRRASEAAKKPFVYRGALRDLSPSDALALFERYQPAVRFKVPADHLTTLMDKVRGEVTWQTNLLGDFTIARAGGKPLYNFASVVDDIDMRITHIVRAEEHLSNTHPQMMLFEAMKGELPVFAHIPFVAAPGTKKKLSKRNPPPGVMVSIDEYRRAGYLPQALINGLARLGWSLDDKTELMDLKTIVDNFSLERVVAAPAGLDPDKIYWMQDQYMRQLPAAERIQGMAPFLVEKGCIHDPPTSEELAIIQKIDAACGERLKLMSDIVRYGEFFFTDEVSYDKDAVKHLKREGAADALESARAALAALETFDLAHIETTVQNIGATTGLGGKINHLVRAATTGRSVGPGVYDCLEILGREKVLARLRQAIDVIQGSRLPIG